MWPGFLTQVRREFDFAHNDDDNTGASFSRPTPQSTAAFYTEGATVAGEANRSGGVFDRLPVCVCSALCGGVELFRGVAAHL